MRLNIFIVFLLSFQGNAAEDACPPTEVVKFAKLYANTNVQPCHKVSAGFSFAPPTGYPTDPQVKALCASNACRTLINDVLALNLEDCYLSFAGVKLNAYKMARSVDDACKTVVEGDISNPTPQPTEGMNQLIQKLTQHFPTPTPTKDKDIQTPKPTESSIQVTAHPNNTKVEEKTHSNSADTSHSAETEVKPPQNISSAELFPTPNTTYKAIEPEVTLRA